MNDTTTDAIQIEQLEGDETVLCVLVAARQKIVVVNSRYPEAEAHARAHIAAGFGDVQICGPDCDGTA